MLKAIENTFFIPYIRLKKLHLNLGVGLSQMIKFDQDYNWYKLPNSQMYLALKSHKKDKYE